jgi:hypothetical protein
MIGTGAIGDPGRAEDVEMLFSPAVPLVYFNYKLFLVTTTRASYG